jgi:1-acyl-sn-glycerol-3-phosphate acyltransferase
VKVTGVSPTLEFKSPLEIDYDKENAQQILDKIMTAIEQTTAFNILHEYDQELKEKKLQEKNQ